MARAYLVVVSKLFNKGLQQHAVQVCRLSLQIEPTSAAHNVLGEYSRAISHLKRAVELDGALEAELQASIDLANSRVED